MTDKPVKRTPFEVRLEWLAERYSDTRQLEVEKLYLNCYTPSRIAAQTGLSLMQVRQRIEYLEYAALAQVQQLGPNWGQMQIFNLIARSRERYRLHRENLDNMIEPVKSLSGMKAEDAFQAQLLLKFTEMAANGANRWQDEHQELLNELEVMPDAGSGLSQDELKALEAATYDSGGDLEELLGSDDD